MKTSGIAVFLLLTALCFSPAQAAGASVEDAKKEGSVVFYGTMNAEHMVRLIQAFNEKYPFIKVESFRGNSERVLNRVLTESRAGSNFVDVINLDGISGWVLKEKGFLQAHKSSETEAFPEQFRDPDGLLPCCIYVITNLMGYNTELVAKKDAPKSYDDLLNPKWAGKLGMDSDESEWFTGLIGIWGKEKAVNYFKALVKQKLSLRRGHTLLAQLTAAGEFPVAVNLFGYRVLELKGQGAPIEPVLADPVLSRPWHMMLAKRAPHPNAGRLFIDFSLSHEGQQLVAGLGRTSVRPGVKIKHPHLVEGVKLHALTPEMGKNHAEISQLYYSIVK